MMTITCSGVLDAEIATLARLPPAIGSILSLARSDGSSARQIAAACELDPALSSRLLALVNAPRIGCRQPVQVLLQAAVILGMNRIRNLALAAHLVDALSFEGTGIERVRFWRHSFAVAAMARWLGQAGKSPLGEDMYLAGLLHDAGLIILARTSPASHAAAALRSREEGTPLEVEEKAALGVSHPEVGRRLASLWPIDGSVAAAIALHEKPWSAAAAGIHPVAGAISIAEMACRHHGGGLILEASPFPHSFTPPAWLPADRDAILAAYPSMAAASIEVGRLLLGEEGDPS